MLLEMLLSGQLDKANREEGGTAYEFDESVRRKGISDPED